jgi:hypothetical protein
MHKEHRDDKNVEQRRDEGCGCGEGFKCEQGGRAQVQKCTVEEGCIEGIWCREYKRQKNRKCKGRAEDIDVELEFSFNAKAIS